MAQLCRLQNRIILKQGDRTLRDLSASVDIQIVDDQLPQSSGLKKRTIATATVDLEIDFADDGITVARYIYLETSREISVKFDLVGNAAFQVAPPRSDPSGQVIATNVRVVGILSLHTNGISKLFISNASGNEADVKYLVVGDLL